MESILNINVGGKTYPIGGQIPIYESSDDVPANYDGLYAIASGDKSNNLQHNWQTILDHTVVNGEAGPYTAKIPDGCSEFFVQIIEVNDPDITSSSVAWLALVPTETSYPQEKECIYYSQILKYVENAGVNGNNRIICLKFSIDKDKKMIPSTAMASMNTGASSSTIVGGTGTGFAVANKNNGVVALKDYDIEQNPYISYGRGNSKVIGVGGRIVMKAR